MEKPRQEYRTKRLVLLFTPSELEYLQAELQRRYPYVLLHDAARALLLKTYLDQKKDRPRGRDSQD
jgi:hypothetical protein